MNKTFNWISSTNPRNSKEVDRLQEQMISFYSHNVNYFDHADNISTLWIDSSYSPYQALLQILRGGKAILEIGCGKANLLKHYPEFEERYCGIDFSSDLIQSNRLRLPRAKFARIEKPERLPFEDRTFDTVFSVFVLEHVVRPHVLLNEMSRILKPDGQMVIVCPDYMGHG